MKKITLLCMFLMTAVLSAQTVFVNEIHYDNSGTDSGEAIEIAGTAGTDVSGWSIVRYNGSNGNMYGMDNFVGTLPDQDNGFGTTSISYPTNGLQNGAPDGFALVNNTGVVVQFLSYEGTLTANDGPAAGMTSTDIGISENSGTAAGTSLQLTGGPGSASGDFTWVGGVAQSFGAVNAGQSFAAVMTPCAISCPPSMTVTAMPGMTSAVVTYADPTLSGDCTMAGFTQTAGLASGASFPLGATTNTFEAVDENTGATVSCSFIVTVNDGTGPEVVCQDITVTLDANGEASIGASDILSNTIFGGYEIDQTGTFAPIDISSGATNVSLGDDQVSGSLPIGFDFNFYGNDYSNFFISSNGFITFNAGTNSGCCSGQFIPNTNNPNNLIAFAWEDLDPGNGGQPAINLVRYNTIGSAPNRILVMEFFNVDHFPSGDAVTSQVHLFEGSNKIEIHTTAQPAGGSHTQGLENADGTEAIATPGRNAQAWTVSNDYVSFTPQVAVPDNDGPTTDIVLDMTDFTCADAGDNTVTVTATDSNGNTSSCTATVSVIPEVSFANCAVDIFTGTGSGVCSAVITFPTPTATSVCGAPVITQTAGPASGSAFPVGTTLVEFTADINGVATFCSFNVTVTDTDLPQLDCPGDFIVSADDSGNYTIEDYTAATDNCTSASNIVTTQEPAAGTVVEEGSTTTVTVTATDEAGNVASCTFDILVDSTLSVSDQELSSSIAIYPNPTRDVITVSNNSNAVVRSMSIVDVSGRVVFSKTADISTTTTLDFSNLAAGIYFVQISADNSQTVKRVVKQ